MAQGSSAKFFSSLSVVCSSVSGGTGSAGLPGLRPSHIRLALSLNDLKLAIGLRLYN
jgi:hypothetical protein